MFPGDSFGEIALTLSKPRIATCVAKGNLHLASLNKDSYNKIFEKQVIEMNKKMNCFCSQFGAFSRDAVIKLTYDFKEMRVLSQSYIFKQNEKANMIYLLKSGCIKLIMNNPKVFCIFFFYYFCNKLRNKNF